MHAIYVQGTSEERHSLSSFVRTRRACLLAGGALGGAIVLGLAACGGFFAPSTELPTLYVGDVQASGTYGYVLVAVVDMPAGGLAAIQFGEVGSAAIALSDIDPASVEIEGVNGFVVLAEAFGPVGGAVIAASGADGVVGGDILRFTFTVTGDNPMFVVTKASVRLASDEGEFVTAWTLRTSADAVYIAR
ncbi:MAG: hypothetical protein NTY63_08810 [Candidatus Bipolaricaulota bacterium]|nr:hypothetical protein [Candidatus Bipolaricaulota bacterium]